MAFRMVEIIAPADRVEEVRAILDEHVVSDVWIDDITEGRSIVRAAMDAGDTELVTDELTRTFSYDPSFRVIIVPIEAILPRREEEEPAKQPIEPKRRLLFGRSVSRDELYEEVRSSIRSWPVFLIMTVLSVIVAAAGLARDNVAVIIGAMVIAPLLGPNIGMAFATTLGDVQFGWRTLKFNLAGVGVALLCSIIIGALVPFDPSSAEIVSRMRVDGVDLIVAMAAGIAGALAFTTGLSSAFIGVMVAVALMPPTVACGLLVGAGEWQAAGGAALLLAVNVTCINLTAILTFLVQGIRPLSWWEKDRARKAARIAVLLWVGILITLMVLLAIAQRTEMFAQKPGTQEVLVHATTRSNASAVLQ